MRRVASSSEFFDILDRIGNGKFVTIGYVSAANLDVPKVSRKNPLTNRMKGYPDYSVFGGDNEIGALVKITSYNMQYLNRSTVSQKYGEYKQSANTIRDEFGLDPIGSKESYKEVNNWSANGPELYKGSNDSLKTHSYNPQNIYGVKPKSVIYTVGTDGHIMNELTQQQIIPYLKKKREIDGVAALRKMNAEEETIQRYIEKINSLKFKYINFESDSILWIAATVNGEKIVYINDNLSRAVDGINIQPQDFRAIARERYKIDLMNLQEQINRNMKKTSIRLTENELRSVINESVKKILSEMDWKTYQNAANKAEDEANSKEYDSYHRQRRQNQANAFKGKAREMLDKQYGLDKIKEKQNQARLNGSFYNPTNGELKRSSQATTDAKTYYQGKQDYKNGKWGPKNESVRKQLEEGFKNNQNYSHFAVNKQTNKIVNGWDYHGYDSDELRQFKNDYFTVDLIDYGFNPKDYKIVGEKFLLRNGIDPNDNSNWSQY